MSYTLPAGNYFVSDGSKTPLASGGYYTTGTNNMSGAKNYSFYDANGVYIGDKAQQGLDSFLSSMQPSSNASTSVNSSGVATTSTDTTKPTNYFKSEEFQSYKDLSLDLAKKAEDRDMRLMDKAAIKRDQEYGRNYSRASNLYNAGASNGLVSGASNSSRHDGMS